MKVKMCKWKQKDEGICLRPENGNRYNKESRKLGNLGNVKYG